MIPTPMPEVLVCHTDFANEVLHNRRAAVNLTLDQIQQMAAAILILDHDLLMARERASLMLAESAKDVGETNAERSNNPKAKMTSEKLVKFVRLVEGKSRQTAIIIDGFLDAFTAYENAKYSDGENIARQKFEKAAIAMVGIYKPKGTKS